MCISIIVLHSNNTTEVNDGDRCNNTYRHTFQCSLASHNSGELSQHCLASPASRCPPWGSQRPACRFHSNYHTSGRSFATESHTSCQEICLWHFWLCHRPLQWTRALKKSTDVNHFEKLTRKRDQRNQTAQYSVKGSLIYYLQFSAILPNRYAHIVEGSLIYKSECILTQHHLQHKGKSTNA